MSILALPNLRLRRSPVRRGRTAVTFVVVLAVVMVFGAFTLVDIVLHARPGSLIVFAKAALIMSIASLPSLGLVWYIDRWERESRWLMAAALLWGAIASTGLAAGVNSYGDQVVGRLFTDVPLLMDFSQRVAGGTADVGYLLVSWLVAPGVEEFCKMQAIIALLWLARREFNGVRDGIVYGALVGIGFNVMEGAISVVHGYGASGDPAVAPYIAQWSPVSPCSGCQVTWLTVRCAARGWASRARPAARGCKGWPPLAASCWRIMPMSSATCSRPSSSP